MGTNPDNKNYVDLGPQSKQLDSEGNEMEMDARYLIPVQHQLRFVIRAESQLPQGIVKDVRILQQYQWSMEEGQFDWYDVPMVNDG